MATSPGDRTSLVPTIGAIGADSTLSSSQAHSLQEVTEIA